MGERLGNCGHLVDINGVAGCCKLKLGQTFSTVIRSVIDSEGEHPIVCSVSCHPEKQIRCNGRLKKEKAIAILPPSRTELVG